MAPEAQRADRMHAGRDDNAPAASRRGGVYRLLNLRAPALGGDAKIARIRAKRKGGKNKCLRYLVE